MLNKRQAFAAICVLTLAACSTPLSTHRVQPADLGAPATQAALLESATRRGIAAFETIVAADWHFPNTTRAPGTAEWSIRQLDAQIYFYAIRHPRFGLHFIDAGMPRDYEAHMGPILRGVVRDDYGFTLRVATEEWVGEHGAPRAVFATHLHYDHVLGAAPLARDIPVYAGPGDGAQRSFFYRFINQPTRKALAGRELRSWRFAPPREGELAFVDIFGDGSVFAIHAPGHTPGSTAYLVNAQDGSHLITGDAFHSREAWSGELEEATGFEEDLPQIHATHRALRALAANIPGLIVHPGHQQLER
jgi:N-acyl homoserine lactone hydrolase